MKNLNKTLMIAGISGGIAALVYYINKNNPNKKEEQYDTQKMDQCEHHNVDCFKVSNHDWCKNCEYFQEKIEKVKSVIKESIEKHKENDTNTNFYNEYVEDLKDNLYVDVDDETKDEEDILDEDLDTFSIKID